MQLKYNLACHHLKGSKEGAKCGAVDLAIRLMEDVSIKLCLSRHHEACKFYRLSLRNVCSLSAIKNEDKGIPGNMQE